MWWILAWILAVAGLLAYLTDPISLFATTRPDRASSETRVAVLFDAWVGSTPSDGGASVFAHLVQPLNADVFLALSHDARDGCTTQRRKCDAAALLPALRGRIVRAALDRASTSEELGAILAALPHWAAIVAAHSAPGARVRCDAVPFSLTFNCSGVHQGNHFLAPVLGNGDLRHPLHNLHQLRGMARALALLAEHEAATGAAYARVVRSRLDLRWLAAHPPLSLLPATSVWIPLGEDYYGGLNDRHAVLSRAAATAYFGRWAAILDGSVLDIDAQLAARRVDDGQALNPENFLTASLAKRGLRVRRFAPVMFLGCCDAKEVCFADARYERRLPRRPAAACERGGGSGGSGGGGGGGDDDVEYVCGKYGHEVERAVYTALALRLPGARFAALAAGARDGPSDAHVVVGVPVAAANALSAARRQLKWRFLRGQLEMNSLVATGRFRRGGGGGFEPQRRARRRQQQQQWRRQRAAAAAAAAAALPRDVGAGRVGYCDATTDDDPGDCEAGDRGMWRMGAASNITDERSCLAHCLERCERCHYVSVSRRNADCSWYAFCDLKRLHLEFHGDSYRTFRTGREEGC